MATTKKRTTKKRASSKKRPTRKRAVSKKATPRRTRAAGASYEPQRGVTTRVPAGVPVPVVRSAFRSVRLTCVYTYGDDRWWGAEVLGAKGVYSQGRTLNSAKANLREAIELMLAEAPNQFPVRARRAPRNTPSLVSEFIWAAVPE